MKVPNLSRSFLAIFVLISAQNSNAGWFGPADYDECIIGGMKGVQSNLAAKLVQNSCRKKFPKKPANQRKGSELPPDEKNKVAGKASIGEYNGRFGGTIYNGSETWNVTQVIVEITEENYYEKLVESFDGDKARPKSETYRVNISVPPYSSKTFSVQVNWPKGRPHGWFISEVLGYKE